MTRMELKQRAKAQLGGQLFGNEWMLSLLVCFLVTALTGAAGSVIPGMGAMLVLGPLSVAAAALFLDQARSDEAMDIGRLFSGFTSDFGGNFVLGFLSSLFVALWSLLFVIPGVAKSYSYAMIYYVKADHPEYDWRTCLAESSVMMYGHRLDLFILDLSFIGWYLVGALCLGLGTLWVAPYHMATRTQFYEELCAAGVVH